MMRSFRWLQSRLARTGMAAVLLGTAVGCTPTHSTINGKNAAVPPKTVFPANTTGLGASSPAFNNLSGAGSGLGTNPTNRVGEPRLMNPTPGTGGAQLQQSGLSTHQQNNLTQPGIQTQPVQPALHQQLVPQQPSVNQTNYSPQVPSAQNNIQVPTQPRQFAPAQQQVPNLQIQQGNHPSNTTGAAVPATQGGQQQLPVPLPTPVSQVPTASPNVTTAARQPELTPPTITTPAQGIQQASHSQYVLPPIDPPPAAPGTITSPSRVFADQKPNVPAPVTSAASDPNYIAPAQMNPVGAFAPNRNR